VNENQIRGRIFEEILKFYLEQQGYEIIPKQIQNYYGVRSGSNGLNVKGRGGWHQIDALGQFQFQIPFIYPIRLISEAKCQKNRIGLPIMRNFVGVLKDISENYFIDKYKDLKYKDRFRFTDCGAIFSTSEFTKEAQMYAYAQGIYLIQTKGLLNLILKGIKKFKDSKKGFSEFVKKCQFIDALDGHYDNRSFRYFLVDNEKIFCYFGLASGFYPIAIVSKDEIPFEKFREVDEVDVKIYYTYQENRENKERTREIYDFEIRFDKWGGTFQLPRYIWVKYMEAPDFKEAMLNMKEKILNHIDIPTKINNMRRIIRFKLDKSWIDTIRERRDHWGK
jgi:hypothetical protein